MVDVIGVLINERGPMKWVLMALCFAVIVGLGATSYCAIMAAEVSFSETTTTTSARGSIPLQGELRLADGKSSIELSDRDGNIRMLGSGPVQLKLRSGEIKIEQGGDKFKLKLARGFDRSRLRAVFSEPTGAEFSVLTDSARPVTFRVSLGAASAVGQFERRGYPDGCWAGGKSAFTSSPGASMGGCFNSGSSTTSTSAG